MAAGADGQTGSPCGKVPGRGTMPGHGMSVPEARVMTRPKEVLVEALRGGVDQAEIRLYRAGKWPGLFNGRTTLHAELARHALQQGLIEVVRTEARGKAPVEWVRVTPRGVEYVLQAESPV